MNQRIIPAALGALVLLSAASTHAQSTRNGEPYGILSKPIVAGQLGLVSTPFVRPAEYLGVVTGNTSNTLTDALAPFTAGQFNESTSSDNNFYVEITSGKYTGQTVDIVSNTTTVLSLSTKYTTLATLEPDATFVIRKNWNLFSLFGTNAPVGISGAPSSGTATKVGVYDSSTGGITNYFFKSTAPRGWRYTADAATDKAFIRLDPNNAFIIDQPAGKPATNLIFSGSVRNLRTLAVIPGTTAGRQALIPNPSPFASTLGAVTNLSQGSFVTDSGIFNNFVTLVSSNGNTISGSSSSFSARGNASSGTADQVKQYFGASGSFSNFYWRTVAPAGWRSDVDSSTPQPSVVIPAGSAAVYQRSAAGAFLLGINPIFRD
jgi:uncharacterized protein (TIGR02597 family)